MGKNIIELIVTGKDLSGKELDQVNKNIDQVGQSLQKAGAVAMAAGVAMTAAFVAAARESQNLQHEIAKALTLVDASGDSYDRMEQNLSKLAINMSRKLNISAQEVSKGYYQVLSTGAEAGTDAFKNMTESALRLSKVVGLDTSRSVEVLSDTINAFNGDMADAEKYANTFFLASRLTTTTVSQLAEAMRTAGPTAASMNISLSETTAVLAAMAAKGTKAALAGTSLRMILTKLTVPNKEAADAMEQLNLKIYDEDRNLRSLIDIFADLKKSMIGFNDEQRNTTLKALVGEEAFAKLAAVLGSNIDTMREWEERLNSTSELQDAHAKLLESSAEKYEAMKIEMKNAAIVIGNQMLPILTDLYKKVTEILVSLGDWAGRNPEVIRSLIMVSTALVGTGGFVVAVGTAMRAVAALKLVMLATFSTTGFAIAGVIGLSIAVAALAGNVSKARRQMNEMLDLAGKKHTLNFELPKALEKGIKYSVDVIKGQEYIKHFEKIIKEIRTFAKHETVKVWIDGRVNELSVDKAIEYYGRRIDQIKERIGIDTPVIQRLFEDVQKKMEDAKRIMPGVEIDVFIRGRMQKVTRGEYLTYLEKLKAELASGDIPSELVPKIPVDIEEDKVAQILGTNEELMKRHAQLWMKLVREMSQHGQKMWKTWMPTPADVASQVAAIKIAAEEGLGDIDFINASQNAFRYKQLIKELKTMSEDEVIEIDIEGRVDEMSVRDAILLLEQKLREENIKLTVPIMLDDDVIDSAYTAMGTIEGAFNAGLQRMLASGNKFSDSMSAVWRSLASAVITELSRIIAKYVMVGIARALAFNVALPGFIAGPIAAIGAMKMQSGGTITTAGVIHSGVRGLDTVPIRAGRGETMLDHSLTDNLRDFLNDSVSMQRGRGGNIIMNIGLYSGTEQSAVELASHLRDVDEQYDRKNVAKGTI